MSEKSNKKWGHADIRDPRADQDIVTNKKYRLGEDTGTTGIEGRRRLEFDWDSTARPVQARKLLMKWWKDKKPEVWTLSPVNKRNRKGRTEEELQLGQLQLR